MVGRSVGGSVVGVAVGCGVGGTVGVDELKADKLVGMKVGKAVTGDAVGHMPQVFLQHAMSEAYELQ